MNLPEGNEQPQVDQCLHGVGTPGQWGDPDVPWSLGLLTRLDPTYVHKQNSHIHVVIQIANLVHNYIIIINSPVDIPWPSLEHHGFSEPLVRPA